MTLTTIKSLGTIYWKEGKLGEAEKMYERALQGSEKTNGIEHASTLSIVLYLGKLYHNQGKLDKAERMYQRTLGKYNNTLGLHHKSTVLMTLKLNHIYEKQGKQVKAIYKPAASNTPEPNAVKAPKANTANMSDPTVVPNLQRSKKRTQRTINWKRSGNQTENAWTSL